VIDFPATRLEPENLREGGHNHDHRGQQHGGFSQPDHTTRHHETQPFRGGAGGPVFVAFGVLEHAEKKCNRQKIEENFHGVIMAATGWLVNP